jgi:Flp pilus assembly pilin Flp
MKSKNVIGFLAAFISMAMVTYAEVDQKVLSASVAATYTNTATAQMKGTVEQVRILVPALGTCSVVIASSEGTTIFTKTCTAGTNFYYPRVGVHTTAGAAYSDAGTTCTNTWPTPIMVIGDVTATFTGLSTVTGTVSAVINLRK